MGNTDTTRVFDQEGANTFVGFLLSDILQEIDSRITGANMFVKFFRDSNNLLERIDYYRDDAFSNLAVRREIDRVSGATGLLLINQVVTTFYETDGVTVDSQVSAFLERDLTVSGDDYIQSCSGYFWTTESTKK